MSYRDRSRFNRADVTSTSNKPPTIVSDLANRIEAIKPVKPTDTDRTRAARYLHRRGFDDATTIADMLGLATEYHALSTTTTT